jgi:predicted transglutaminase-like cysteine proteinase
MARGRLIWAALAAALSLVGNRVEADEALPKAQPSAYAPVALALDHPPVAWPDYCVRHGDDCRVDLDEPVLVDLTPARLQELKAVNTAINRVVLPMTDIDHWGVEDHWDQAEDGYGDCEDYQLLKRKLLVEAGFPRRTMLMTVAHDDNDNGHALLMVRTSLGDLILDNLGGDVLPWRETGYRFIQRESQYASGWVDIEDLPDTTAVVAGAGTRALSETTAAAGPTTDGRPYDLAGGSE